MWKRYKWYLPVSCPLFSWGFDFDKGTCLDFPPRPSFLLTLPLRAILLFVVCHFHSTDIPSSGNNKFGDCRDNREEIIYHLFVNLHQMIWACDKMSLRVFFLCGLPSKPHLWIECCPPCQYAGPGRQWHSKPGKLYASERSPVTCLSQETLFPQVAQVTCLSSGATTQSSHWGDIPGPHFLK